MPKLPESAAENAIKRDAQSIRKRTLEAKKKALKVVRQGVRDKEKAAAKKVASTAPPPAPLAAPALVPQAANVAAHVEPSPAIAILIKKKARDRSGPNAKAYLKRKATVSVIITMQGLCVLSSFTHSLQAQDLLAQEPDPYATVFNPKKRRLGESSSSKFRHRRECEKDIRGALQVISETLQTYSSDVGARVLAKLNSEGGETIKLVSKALSRHDIPPAIIEIVKSMNSSSRQNNTSQGRQTMLTLALVVLKPYLRDGGKVELSMGHSIYSISKASGISPMSGSSMV